MAPVGAPLGVVRGVAAQGLYGQAWSGQESRSVLIRASDVDGLDRADGQRVDFHRHHVSARIAPGIGRVRNADGVFAAMLLEERLARDGVLTGPLSPASRERLARLFYVRPLCAVVHALPDKAFWRDVEAALADDPAVRPGGLGAYAVLHALEPLVVARGSFARPAGWFVGPAATLEHEHTVRRDARTASHRRVLNGTRVSERHDRFDARTASSSDDVLLGLVAEAHRPLGSRRQLDARLEASTDPDRGGADLRLASRLDFAQLAGERWFAAARIMHDRWTRGGDGVRAEWRVLAEARCEYYLEDRWSVGLLVRHAQRRDAAAPVPAFARETGLDLSTRFDWGRLEAPGLIAPVAPLHPPGSPRAPADGRAAPPAAASAGRPRGADARSTASA